MKTSHVLLAVCLLYLSQSLAFAQYQSVTLENVHTEYKSLDEVKPVLVNAGDKSIFLRPEECGEILVTDIDGEYWWNSGTWECLEIGPIEIKPGERYQFPGLVIRFEQEEGKFIEETEGKPGKYEMMVSYSFSPTYRNGKPEMKHTIRKEFSIVR